MVITCSVNGCKSRYDKDRKVGFFRIPRVITHQGEKTEALSRERNFKWLKTLSLGPGSYFEHIRICSKHFFCGAPSALYDTTNPDWLPSKCLNAELDDINLDNSKVERYLRKRKRSSLPKDQVQKNKNRKIKDGNKSLGFNVSDRSVKEDSGIGDSLLEELALINDTSLSSTRLDSNEIVIAKKDNKLVTPSLQKSNSSTQTLIIETVNVGLQTYIHRKDFSVQVIVKTKVSDVCVQTERFPEASTQTEVIEICDKATQTLFRVVEKFQLEMANFKADNSRKEIENLKSMLKIANGKIKESQEEIALLKTKIEKLKKELDINKCDQSAFVHDDDRTKFFTGLETYATLSTLYKGIEIYLFQNSKLTPFQQFYRAGRPL